MSTTSEKSKAYYKEWYQRNKKRLTEERRKYQKEYISKWREKNREKYNAYHREWRARRKAKEELNLLNKGDSNE
jgi:hypothetical protein